MPAAGPFFWCELIADDPAASAAWLAPSLGWTADGGLLRRGALPVARVVQLGDEEAAPHWLLHLAVPDLGAVCRRAAFLQGRVLIEPEAVADVGEGAVIADPLGCVLHPFQLLPGFHASAPSGAEGTLAGAVLFAPRVDLGARFYGALLGWERGAGGVWTADGGPIAAAIEAPRDAVAQWIPAFVSTDLDTLVARVAAVGGRLLARVGGGFGQVAVIEGPDGVVIAARAP